MRQKNAMGLSDRDYARYESRTSYSRGGGWDVLTWIVAINIAVLVLQLVWTKPDPDFPTRESVITQWFSLSPNAVLHGQVWRLLTYDFLHSTDSVWHIIVNMYILWISGRRLLTIHTSREFLLFYLSAAVVSGIAFLGWQVLRGQSSPAIGASGAVAAVMLLYALYWPRDVWMILGIIPVPVMVLAVLAAALDLFPLLSEFGSGRSYDNVAHAAHLGGMLFAYLYYARHWRIESLWPSGQARNWQRMFRRKPKLRVHQPTEEPQPLDSRELQAKVDELLEKIHLHGEQSLTDDERETLNTASRMLRNRRRKVT